eukprot:Phypoly_transcript_03344.p2 GENE.Phypoly_transcript_03344~~Phypoly_transcript_03344.p2  ORF type:complete len:252 (+),score=33.86 Phypoly_transcript_03344:1707-2462(+)
MGICAYVAIRYTDPPVDPAGKNSDREVGDTTENSEVGNSGVENSEVENSEIEESEKKAEKDSPSIDNEGEEPEEGGIILSDITAKKEGEETKEREEEENKLTEPQPEPTENVHNLPQHNLKWVLFKTRYLETLSPVHLVISFVITTFLTFISFHWDAPLGISIVFLVIMLIPASLMFFLNSKNIPKTFKCPGMPLIPLISITFNIYLMVSLTFATWVRLIVWLLIGLIVYFSYGIKHSNLGTKSYVNLPNV